MILLNMIICQNIKLVDTNYLTLNTSKTIAQIYIKRNIDATLNIKINGVSINQMETIKYLGVLIDTDIKFTSHINSITNIVSRNMHARQN